MRRSCPRAGIDRASAGGTQSSRSVPRRASDRSQASIVPLRDACSGSTFDTRKTSSRRPAMASAIISSAAPYISAVSMWVMPRSMPRRSAVIAPRRSPLSMRQVPCPMTATARVREPNGRNGDDAAEAGVTPGRSGARSAPMLPGGLADQVGERQDADQIAVAVEHREGFQPAPAQHPHRESERVGRAAGGHGGRHGGRDR